MIAPPPDGGSQTLATQQMTRRGSKGGALAKELEAHFGNPVRAGDSVRSAVAVRRGGFRGVLDPRTTVSGELLSDAAEAASTESHAFMDLPSDADDRTDTQQRAEVLVPIFQIRVGPRAFRATFGVTVAERRILSHQ